MREAHYIKAMAEYEKRLSIYCKFRIIEIPEQRLSDNPSAAEINSGLQKEASLIEKSLDTGDCLVAMCIEGRELSSLEFSKFLESQALSGSSRITFLVGGSFGLHENIKNIAQLRLSMSPMTFPHHLARVMLAEQIYRAFNINHGGKYHK